MTDFGGVPESGPLKRVIRGIRRRKENKMSTFERYRHNLTGGDALRSWAVGAQSEIDRLTVELKRMEIENELSYLQQRDRVHL